MSQENESCKKVVWGSFALALLVWMIQAARWWRHLEGDYPLYSLMSLEVLRGNHFLMTANQSHGGTILVYIRAGLFWLFGHSPFLGEFTNGIFVSLAVALWVRFACKIGGKRAGVVMGLLGAFPTEAFVRQSSTDYYTMAVLFGGIYLNLALALARMRHVDWRTILGVGVIVGLGTYSCTFSLLYLIGAFGFFLALADEVRRAQFIPSRRELRGIFARVLSVVFVVSLVLAVVFFFASDRIFGIGVNAEHTLKFAIKTGIVLWFWCRWRLIALNPGKTGALVVGAVTGFLPEIIFKANHVHIPLAKGLARWSDLGPRLPELWLKLQTNFNFRSPWPWGAAAVGALAAILLLGLYQAKSASVGRAIEGKLETTARRRAYAAALLMIFLPLCAWVGMRTYMYIPLQYFFSTFFALYLAAALATSYARFRWLAMALVLPILVSSWVDIGKNIRGENEIARSGVIEKLEEWENKWDVHSGFGHYPTNYNLMLSTLGRWKIPWLATDERFPEWQDLVWKEKRIFYVYRTGDRGEVWTHPGYRVLERSDLGEGFTAKLLEKN